MDHAARETSLSNVSIKCLIRINDEIFIHLVPTVLSTNYESI